MDININVRFSAEEAFAGALLALASAYEAAQSAQAWKAVDSAAAHEVHEAASAAKQTLMSAKDTESKPKQVGAKPVSARENGAINDMLAVPSAAEAGDPEGLLAESELSRIRPQVAAFLKSSDGGKEKLRSFLDAHGAERVTKVKRKDVPALLALIGGKEDKDA